MKIELHIEGDKIISARVIGRRAKVIETSPKALSFLLANLKVGPRMSAELFVDAKEVGISKEQLYRAAKYLGVNKYPSGYRACDGWTWELKNDKQTDVAQLPAGVESGVDGTRKEILGVAFGNGLQDWEEPGS